MKKDTSTKLLINSNGVKFIALAGVDGSGKSTQVEKLMAALLAKGYEVAYFHAFSGKSPCSTSSCKKKPLHPEKKKR